VLQRTLEAEDAEAQTGPRLVSIMRGGEEVWLSLSEAVMRDPLGVVAGRISSAPARHSMRASLRKLKRLLENGR
jgi:hypothetical protein